MRRTLRNGVELDDDATRVPVGQLHAFLSTQAYWAIGRPRGLVEQLVRDASRVVGLYDGERLIGFCRAVTDGLVFVYLADVYVDPAYRGRGLGVELVREMIDNGPFASRRWILHTEDAHSLYEKFGFAAPDHKLMERPPRR
jgi:ribosomal protein S18 acetylase RimI-like enzyme